MPKPSLFAYATSELSQDAALCWLLAWAQPEAREQDSHLHELAISLIRTCFDKHGESAPERIDSVEIRQQFLKIDVLAAINQETALLIEDKVFSREHSDQLVRYRRDLESSEEYRDITVLPIYLQTGEQSNYSAVEAAGYKVLRRGELIQLLKRPIAQGCRNAILTDFHDHLVQIDQDIESYRTAPLDSWSGRAWQGFFGTLQKAGVRGDWKYVHNQSGGFWGFWWGWYADHQSSVRVEAYLQLEEDLLCFKIWVPDTVNRRSMKQSWSRRIIEAGQQAGLNVIRPSRLGSGETMTVAILKGDYRVATLDGRLDMEGTISQLRAAEHVFTSATAQGAGT